MCLYIYIYILLVARLQTIQKNIGESNLLMAAQDAKSINMQRGLNLWAYQNESISKVWTGGNIQKQNGTQWPIQQIYANMCKHDWMAIPKVANSPMIPSMEVS